MSYEAFCDNTSSSSCLSEDSQQETITKKRKMDESQSHKKHKGKRKLQLKVFTTQYTKNIQEAETAKLSGNPDLINMFEKAIQEEQDKKNQRQKLIQNHGDRATEIESASHAIIQMYDILPTNIPEQETKEMVKKIIKAIESNLDFMHIKTLHVIKSSDLPSISRLSEIYEELYNKIEITESRRIVSVESTLS